MNVALLVSLLALGARPPLPVPEEDEPPTTPAKTDSIPIARDAPIGDAPSVDPEGLPPGPGEHRTESFAAAITFELGGQAAHVDLGGGQTDGGGALGGHLFIMGHSRALTYRAYANGAIGGQTSGFLTRFTGDASFGPALALGSSSRLFLRIGIEASGHKDDELDTSLFTLPSGYGGLQVTTHGALFEIGPRTGATLRAVYAPGNESEGRRHSRRSRVAPSWGGSVAMVTNILLVEASLTRVEERAGLWFAEGSACPLVRSGREQAFVLCASAQHWRSAVAGPLAGGADVGSWVLGASIGFGFINNKRL